MTQNSAVGAWSLELGAWSLIPANPGRYFHAMPARLMPIVKLKLITKCVSHFLPLKGCHRPCINILL